MPVCAKMFQLNSRQKNYSDAISENHFNLFYSSGSVLPPFTFNGFVAKIEFVPVEVKGSSPASGSSSGSRATKKEESRLEEDADADAGGGDDDDDYEEENQGRRFNRVAESFSRERTRFLMRFIF